MALTAYLTGSCLFPEFRLPFGFEQELPHKGQKVRNWVKTLGDRRWDKASKTWYLTGCEGQLPSVFFQKHGIEVSYAEVSGDLVGVHIDELLAPFTRMLRHSPFAAEVFPRLAGRTKVGERLGNGAIWNDKTSSFTAPITEFFDDEGNPKRNLPLPGAARTLFQRMRAPLPIPDDVRASAAALSVHPGSDDNGKTLSADALAHLQVVSQYTGKIPRWFGLDLFPFQRCGAYAVVAGHNLLCDEPGLGKTRSSMAAAAMFGASRLVIVCPPLVLTNWAREAAAAFGPSTTILGAPMYQYPKPAPAPELTKAGKPKKVRRKKKAEPDWIAVLRAGVKADKLPPLPDTGIVIVGDSLLANRPELFEMIQNWRPDVAIYDEVHRSRTWSAARSTATRALSENISSTGGLNIPVTGTPVLAKPSELANLLALSGHLYRHWGSAAGYLDRYGRLSKFGWTVKKSALPDLRDHLFEHVWTRRNKKDVLKSLPPKLRAIRIVDIDERPFEEAHTELFAKVNDWFLEWFENHDCGLPGEGAIDDFAKGRVDLMSPLRKAAGVAKAPVAAQIVREWVEDTTVYAEDGSILSFERPMLVWAHHKEVLAAVRAELEKAVPGRVGFIDGSLASEKRQLEADRMQNGELAVMVLSTIAAGFGLTLTRSSDAIIVEQDWTPANISQAEDRQNRIGATRQTQVTTLMAPNTLDPQIRAVLMNKAEILESLTPGSDNHVARVSAVINKDGEFEEVTAADVEMAQDIRSETDVLRLIVQEVIRQNDYENPQARRNAWREAREKQSTAA